ncbi:xanthine dehydrogenase family protein subunit M [Erwinia pyri]|uniref:Xanthine dehydrogenase family protein subunit M n=1 Tax=Erwinia pyri TaxID=3062598 RepID=A0AA50HLI3_9GAMM|nr:xanthine dehydrogenase family protein subunit M [Erwinia sp. DE2]WLS78156.1 xanthine dehydrogenase family protein subunit M [Erwinia sp. DE2]
MNPFSWQTAASVTEAAALKKQPGTQLLAGGTTQLDLMKCDVFQPTRLIPVTQLTGMDTITFSEETITLGAMVYMSELASHEACQRQAPAIYDSLWQAASPQIRNMATLGGNLCQRTRCGYYRDPHTFSDCNKRNPGSGCAALKGVNRSHAILGGSESCVAVYPGDLAVALTAFDAVVILENAQGIKRRVPIEQFYLLPGDAPHKEHDMGDDELITAIEIPQSAALQNSTYLKVRDRSSYEFAAASAAVGLVVENGIMVDVRIALGGVATKPWRAHTVEQALKGQRFDETLINQAAERVIAEAQPLADNAHKIKLVPRVIARALMAAGETA